MEYTDVVFAKNTPMPKSERRKLFREKLTWSDFLVEYWCVPLDSVSPFCYGCSSP